MNECDNDNEEGSIAYNFFCRSLLFSKLPVPQHKEVNPHE